MGDLNIFGSILFYAQYNEDQNYYISHITCHISHVFHLSFLDLKFFKVLELVGGVHAVEVDCG